MKRPSEESQKAWMKDNLRTDIKSIEKMYDELSDSARSCDYESVIKGILKKDDLLEDINETYYHEYLSQDNKEECMMTINRACHEKEVEFKRQLKHSCPL